MTRAKVNWEYKVMMITSEEDFQAKTKECLRLMLINHKVKQAEISYNLHCLKNYNCPTEKTAISFELTNGHKVMVGTTSYAIVGSEVPKDTFFGGHEDFTAGWVVTAAYI